MYEFSMPMPYTVSEIDIIKNINKKLKKSKITSLYFALPYTDKNFTGFEQGRTCLKYETDINSWINVLKYVKNSNFDFIYLLNSTRPINLNNKDLEIKLKKLDILICELDKIGLRKYRIANPKLISYLNERYPELELYSSTSFDYTSIKEYQNFIEMFPYLKQIVLSHDINKNFKLLENLKNLYPNLEFEIMVNEGCMGGCPIRPIHSSEIFSLCPNSEYNKFFGSGYNINTCNKILKKDLFLFLCKAHNIYPWEIQEYEKIGYTKFKLVGRDIENFPNSQFFNNCETYLKGIDDYKLIENFRINRLIHRIGKLPFPYIKDIRPFLPNIKHFIKKGHLCSSICGVECFYCYECSNKMHKYLNNIHL